MFHICFRDKDLSWELTLDVSYIGWGSDLVGVELDGKTEKGEENGLSTGAWEVEEYEGGITAPAQQTHGQQINFVCPNTLQAEVGKGERVLFKTLVLNLFIQYKVMTSNII